MTSSLCKFYCWYNSNDSSSSEVCYPIQPKLVQCSMNSPFLNVVTLSCPHMESCIKSYFLAGKTDINNTTSNLLVFFNEAEETSDV